MCDNFRRLLISDHMSKCVTSILDDYVEPLYYKYIPVEQCGAARGRGTDLATHVVRSAIDYAMILNMSVAILFLDLTKAFDFIIREIAIGWPTRSKLDQIQLLIDVG